jgi:hypothetical protein
MNRENTCGSTPNASTDANGAGRADRLDLLERDFLDRLGEELADEADARDGERENAGEGAEADGLDEHDRHDDRMERPGGDDDEPRRPRGPRRHQVARRDEADRQRERDAQRARQHGDLEALLEAIGQQLPALEVRRKRRPKNLAAFSRPVSTRAHETSSCAHA